MCVFRRSAWQKVRAICSNYLPSTGSSRASRDTQRIQETLLPVEHIICELVEEELFDAMPSSGG